MLKFVDAVYRIYETALSPDRWPAALEGVAALSGSAGAMIYVKAPVGESAAEDRIVAYAPALAEAVEAYMQEGWWRDNPWLRQAVEASFRIGDVYRDRDILTEHEMAENPFYARFLPRMGLGWQMTAIVSSNLGALTGLVVQRSRKKEPYSHEEMNTLHLVSSHVEQSLRISSHLIDAQAKHKTAAAALDSMEHAAFVLDHERRPLILNKPAQNLMGHYFVESDGRLACAVPREEPALSSAIEKARALPPGDHEAPGPVTVGGPDGASRLVMWALPVVGASADRLDLKPRDPQKPPHVLLLAHPLKRDRAIDPAVLRDIFGLTLGEARLAALVGSGETLKEAAARLGIAEGTARTVLKRVFQKLGVKRQADLVSQLALFARPSTT